MSKVLISKSFSFCLCSMVCWPAGENLMHEHREDVLSLPDAQRIEAFFNRQERILWDILSTLYQLSVCDKADFEDDYII